MATRRARRLRLAAACTATVAILAPIAWLWQDSLMPDTYSATDVGYADLGGGPGSRHVHSGLHGGHGRDVTTLTGDAHRPADVSATLTARRERFRLASGRTIEGYTLNGRRSHVIAAVSRPAATLDPLGYGAPAALGFDPAAANRRFRYDIGRRPGFINGRPGYWWTVNGHTYPDLPAFTVAEGDIVRIRLSNDSGEAHPMHLHGHHFVVLARDGRAAGGSPWWVDSLHVANGESYDIAFVADNPGIWMDHCHNLPHAAQGLVVHLAYTGVTTPVRIGGAAANAPE